MPTQDETMSETDQYWSKLFHHKPSSNYPESPFSTALLFIATSTTYGIGIGMSIGGITAVRKNLNLQKELAIAHIIRCTRFFGIAGIIHGLVGGALVWANNGQDTYKGRFIAGCAGGATMGLAAGPAAACGICAIVGATSWFDLYLREYKKSARGGKYPEIEYKGKDGEKRRFVWDLSDQFTSVKKDPEAFKRIAVERGKEFLGMDDILSKEIINKHKDDL